MQNFSLFSGDAFNWLLQHLGLGSGRPGEKVGRRVLVLWALAWPPVALLSALAGYAIGPTPRQTFLFDLAAYSQLCIGLPILLAAEPFIDERLGRSIGVFWFSGLLPDKEEKRFNTNARHAMAASRWWAVDVILALAAWASASGWLSEELRNGVATWHTQQTASGEVLTLAGAWDGFLSVPLFLYLLYRWIWKVVLWFWMLWRASRIRLQLVVTHPDRAGGLGFLGDLQAVFGILIFAVGSVAAATVGHKLLIEGAPFYSYGILAPLLGFVAAAPTLFLTPLCFFTVQLYRARQDGLVHFAPLASVHARRTHAKLLRSEDQVVMGPARSIAVADTETLESVDDMYERVREMRIVPFDLETVRSLVVTAVGPMVPLLSSQIPGLDRLFEIFK